MLFSTNMYGTLFVMFFTCIDLRLKHSCLKKSKSWNNLEQLHLLRRFKYT